MSRPPETTRTEPQVKSAAAPSVRRIYARRRPITTRRISRPVAIASHLLVRSVLSIHPSVGIGGSFQAPCRNDEGRAWSPALDVASVDRLSQLAAFSSFWLFPPPEPTCTGTFTAFSAEWGTRTSRMPASYRAVSLSGSIPEGSRTAPSKVP